MIGVTDFDVVSVELLERLGLGRWAHPIETLDPGAHRQFQVGDELLDLRLRLRRKIFRGVELSHRPAEIAEAIEAVAGAIIAAADSMHPALPARLLLSLAGKRFVAHLKGRVRERLREVGRGMVGDSESLPRLQDLDRRLGEDGGNFRKGRLLRHDDAFHFF